MKNHDKKNQALLNDVKGCSCKWPICPECEATIEKIYRLNKNKKPLLFLAPVRNRRGEARAHGVYQGQG